MFNSGFLGVVIGLILIYFLLSLLSSGVNEVLEAFLQRRARYLEVGIWDLLGPMTTKFYDHFLIQALHSGKGKPPRIYGLGQEAGGTKKPKELTGVEKADSEEQVRKEREERKKKKKNRPSYIPASAFSRVVLDAILVAQESTTKLKTAIDAGDRGNIGVEVEEPMSFPSSSDFHVTIDGEEFIVRDVNLRKKTWTLNRPAAAGAADHAVGADIQLVPTAAPDADAAFHELEVRLAGAAIPDSLKEPLTAFLETSNRDLDTWRAQVENWFDDKMDRLSGWYKRRTKSILFVIGLALVVVLNADTLLFSRTLWNDATLRSSITAQAQSISKTPPACSTGPAKQNPVACAVKLFDSVKGLNIPLGWTTKSGDPRLPQGAGNWFLRIIGLLLTALALTLGAPFWFDLLNKVVNFRATGPPPGKSSALPAQAKT
jgi:hypothetical protein